MKTLMEDIMEDIMKNFKQSICRIEYYIWKIIMFFPEMRIWNNGFCSSCTDGQIWNHIHSRRFFHHYRCSHCRKELELYTYRSAPKHKDFIL